MPIFVDGVEIKSVYVDGVEQSEVWADGVQVFNNVGEYLFDDFNRSANGTLISAHTMNTGQTWLFTPAPTEPQIQPFTDGQNAYLTATSNAVNVQGVFISPLAPTMFTAEAYVFKMKASFNAITPLGDNIGMRLSDGGANFLAIQMIGVTDGGGHTGAFEIRDQANTPLFVAFPLTGGYATELTVYWDRITGQIQAVETTAAVTTTSTKVAIPFVPVALDLRCSRFFNAGTLVQTGISEFEATPYLSADLPWPV